MKVTEDLAKVSISEEKIVDSLPSSLTDPKQSSSPEDKTPSTRDKAPTGPTRRVERNKSGPNGMRTGPSRRAPPGRSKSHKIGRPVFNKDLPAEPQRGVTRNTSGRLRTAPGRTRSFGRKAPDRSASGNSLKAQRKSQNTGGQYSVDTADTDSVCDSVFTSASNQTLDSIMLRKKQFTDGPAGAAGGSAAAALRRPRNTVEGQPSFEFDESLHTVDSINLHHRHADGEYDEDGDLSVFSESFASTDTYDMSDYDDMDGEVIREEHEQYDDQSEDD